MGALPQVLTFLKGATCTEAISAGDSVLVPIGSEGTSARLAIDDCMDRYLVRYGYAAGFGVPLGSLTHVFDLRNGSLRPRILIRKVGAR